MSVNVESMEKWLRAILGADPESPKLPLGEYLDAIPTLDSLDDLPSGTPVLIRGDVDAKPGAKVGEGDIRLRSMKATLDYGRSKGFKQIVFGHIGRDPEKSLNKVADRIGEILGCDVTFIADWFDAASGTIKSEVAETIQSAAPGSVIVLENTRKYDIERVLWKAKEGDVAKLAPPLAKLANEFAQKVAKVYVNEAFSAGSLDSSSVVVPAAMDRVALGRYVAEEFSGPLTECLAARLVVFSGLKIDKLDDLEAMIARGKVRWIITAGSLAMALLKAAAELDGKQFSLGVSEQPDHQGKPYYIPKERIAQAKQIVAEGREKGIRFIMPVDFVLSDGRVAAELGPADQQLDVGPATSELFENKVGEFIAEARARPSRRSRSTTVYSACSRTRSSSGGTKEFVPQLKRMKDAGVKVYVGGGEGGKALEKYGEESWVTHSFTAGGTVLNALGSEPVPYLVALKLAVK